MIAVNSSKTVHSGLTSSVAMPGGILCAKAFMLLQVSLYVDLGIAVHHLLFYCLFFLTHECKFCAECFSSTASSFLEGASV